MEANQTTCPQCGLANNELAESCVQCGIIFIKDAGVNVPTVKGDQKRKAIEEAEAMLEETQAPPEIDAFANDIIKVPDPHEDTAEMQIPQEETTEMKPEAAAPPAPPEIDAFANDIIKVPDPREDTAEMQIPQEETPEMKPEAAAPPAPPEIDAFANDIIKVPDPHEDTAEMQIPQEETTEMKPEVAATQAPKPEENQNPENQEIEMEAIEAAMETVEGTVNAEALFLSEIDTDKSADTATPETDPNRVGTPAEHAKEDEQSGEIIELKDDKEDSLKIEADALPVDPSEENPMAGPQKEENREEKESAETRSGTAEATETETAVVDVIEPAESEDHSIPADAAQPAEKEMKIEEKPESTTAETAATKAEAPPFAKATIEMPEESGEANTRADEQAEKSKQDALKKQQEAQAKAEALEKEKVAQAVALKKKKLAKVQALKKQKAAQAKAEALKKKKEALAKARASKKQEATLARADALKKQKAAQAMAEASSQEVEHASTGTSQAAAAGMSQYERLLGLLKRYKGKAIGINYDNSSEIREAELIEANEEFFSVRVKDKKLKYSYPLKTILTIVEGQEGVETGEGEKTTKFDAVIKVYPLVLF